MRFWPEPVIICGYRSVLSAWFAVLPFYVLGVLLTRKVWFGHLTALLGVAGVHLYFCSYYGLQVWPDKFTAGTIGQGYALFFLAALIAQWWRSALVLLGLMPIVHLGHMPVVLGVGMVAGVWLWHYRPGRGKSAALAFAAALTCSVSFVVFIHHFSIPPPAEGPFYSDRISLDVWQRFTYYEDIHRAPTTTPRFGAFVNSLMVMVALVLVCAALIRRDLANPGPFLWIFLYTVGCVIAVSAAKIAQYACGPETPYLLIGWLPYRSPNLCAVLLLPVLVYVTAGCLAGREPSSVLNVAALSVIVLALRPVLQSLVPETLYESYIAPPETVLFFLFGAALPRLWRALDGRPRFRALWTACTVLAVGLLAMEHQFGAALVILSGVGVLLLDGMNLVWVRAWNCPLQGAMGVAAVTLLVAMLMELHRDYIPALKNTPFEDEVAAVLAEESRPGELLLTPHWHLNWQEKLCQPIFMTFETPYFLPYMRDLAGPMEKMMEDAYDIHFGKPWDYNLGAWKTRSPTEWREVGRTYGIRFVLSPNAVPVALKPILRGETLTLYEIM